MAAGSTYTPIATQTLGSAVSSVTFSSIPSTYTDLILIANTGFVNTGSDNQFEARVNGDSGSNYSVTGLFGDGSSVYSYRQSNNTWIEMNRINYSLTNTIIMQLNNYSNTSTYKTIITRTNGTATQISATVNLWRSTSAINSISLSNYYAGSNTFFAGSTFTLYGIAAA
jgi:hypothetical protein